MKIRTKLVLCFFIISSFIGIIAYISFHISRNTLEHTIGENASDIAESTINEIDTAIFFRIDQVRAYAFDLATEEGLKVSNEQFKNIKNREAYITEQDEAWKNSTSTELVQKILNEPLSLELKDEIELKDYYKDIYGYEIYKEVFVTNKYGVNCAMTQKTSDYYQGDEEWWQLAKEKGLYLENINFDKSSKIYSINICVRINDKKGRFLGVLKAVLNIQELIDIIKKTKADSVYKTTFFELLNYDGNIIFSTEDDKKIMTGHKKLHTTFFGEDDQHNNYIIVKHLNHEMLLAHKHSTGYKDFKGLGWILITGYNTNELFTPIYSDRNLTLLASIIIIVLAIITGIIISNLIVRPLDKLKEAAQQISEGKNVSKIEIDSKDEIGILAASFNAVAEMFSDISTSAVKVAQGDCSVQIALRSQNDELAKSFNIMTTELKSQKNIETLRNWRSERYEIYNNILRKERDSEALADNICSFFAEHFDIQTAALYLMKNNELHITGTFAYSNTKAFSKIVKLGEGFTGQAVKEKKILKINDIPPGYTRINSGTGELDPAYIITLPLLFHDEIIGVLELGSLKTLDDLKINFLTDITERTANAFKNIMREERLHELLEETQSQSEELQAQHEELMTTNEELKEQTDQLVRYQEKLNNQQEELKASNEELEEKNEILVIQKREIEEKNLSLKSSEKKLKKRTEELALSSKYKSEFLANMSHELRTPLNSLLILSKRFMINKDNNLTEQQVKNAEIIYNSGNDLLNIINDILDLSKIEAGKMEVNLQALNLHDLRNSLLADFSHLTEEKQLTFTINIADNLAPDIITDTQKLEQIVKNFISNSLKFTSTGSIIIDIYQPEEINSIFPCNLKPENALAISVTDTGIGIRKEKLRVIFEAFQQADGSTSRKFGGTGLGLSISRELSKMLGGSIGVESTPGEKTTFTVFIDKKLSTENKLKDIPEKIIPLDKQEVFETRNPQETIPDDKSSISQSDEVILIVEDDLNFAHILYDACNEKGYKCIHACDGATALELANQYLPIGIILDIYLPEMDGLKVLESLKSSKKTKSIPVHIMSVDDNNAAALKKGAIGFIKKPMRKEDLDTLFEKLSKHENCRILIIENNNDLSSILKDNLIKNDVGFIRTSGEKESLALLNEEKFDLVILDLNLSDTSGINLLEQIKHANNDLPIIVFTAKTLTEEEKKIIKKLSSSTVLKNAVSLDRLLDEVALFLHKDNKFDEYIPRGIDISQNRFEDLNESIAVKVRKLDCCQYKNSAGLRTQKINENVLNGKTALLVDDDARNLYLMDQEFKDLGMKTVKAVNGKMAIDIISKDTDIDIIIMDIMMPVMNGYEAIREIKRNHEWSKIPIIAVTAKAMKGDREKCINAGANDYITKPIDIEKLITLMKVWVRK